MKYTYDENGIELADGTKIPFSEVVHEWNKNRYKDSVLLKFKNFINGHEYYFNEVIDKKKYESIKDKLETKEIYLGENPEDGSDFIFTLDNSFIVVNDIDEIVNFVKNYGIVYKNSNFDIIDAIENQE